MAFAHYPVDALTQLPREQVESELLASGLWTALRTRPFSKTPRPGSTPRAIFVTIIDSQPLAADPQVIIAEQPAAFNARLTVLTRLTDGKVHVCHSAGAKLSRQPGEQIIYHEFSGPHPAGLVRHPHSLPGAGQPEKNGLAYRLSGCNRHWHTIYYRYPLTTGILDTHRFIALAGPQVVQPSLLRTRLGASMDELTAGRLKAGENRVISASVLSGVRVSGASAWLGRFHLQVSVLEEGREKELFGWILPSPNKFSITRTTLGHFLKNKRFAFSTSTHGGERAMVPIGNYERVMRLDILPTLLLRELLVGDSDSAQALGCLELDEEDLALCTFVCPGKYEYAPILRDVLTKIDQEG
ncbi:NADH:ubiquinone reductase (Na(+)-transporting) subunit A [Serratia symbiotica]|uniref:NADH:ubiquinone reductase (Na(+)-transporting) subunit A n=1 Tax=Serratia symbiotica TaxID=138074 RepID=UPI003EBC860A